MKILVLEDNPERNKRFMAEAMRANTQLIMTETADRAIECLMENGPFDLVFLDHDLGGNQMVKSSMPDTGAEVARWIRDNLSEDCQNTNFVIHSCNTPGSIYMYDMLRAANLHRVWRVPFINLNIGDVVDRVQEGAV